MGVPNRFRVVEASEVSAFCSRIAVMHGESSTKWPWGVYDAFSVYENPFIQAIAGSLTMLNNVKVYHWHLPGGCSAVQDMKLFQTNPQLSTLYLPDCSVMDEGQFSGYAGIVKNVSLGLLEAPSWGFTSCHFSYLNLPSCSIIRNCCFNDAKCYSYSLPLVETVENNGLLGCQVSKVDLPMCKHISGAAFAWCGSLTEVYLPKLETIQTVAEGGGNFFCGAAPTKFNIGMFTIVSDLWSNITKSVVTDLIFSRCTTLTGCNGFYNLTNLYIPLCTEIGYNGLNGASALTKLDLTKVTVLGSYALRDMWKLEDLVDTTNITTIGSSCFYGCSKLVNLSFPNCSSMGNGCFGNMSALKTVNAPLVSGSLPRDLFYRCSQLENVTFGKINYLDRRVFMQCSNLANLDFDTFSEVSYVGSAAFSGCIGLTQINFPACSTVCASAFLGCAQLSVISLPAITSAMNSAFSGVNSSCRFIFDNFISVGNMFGAADTTGFTIDTTSAAYSQYIADASWAAKYSGSFISH